MDPFVEWDARYDIGIPKIDEQHRELVNLTNKLYEACKRSNEEAVQLFKDALRKTVEYVKFHFSFEERLLVSIHYPDVEPHKSEHREFVKKVLEDSVNFTDGKSFAPHQFARYLRDWILSHIAVSDKKYADFIVQRKKDGAL